MPCELSSVQARAMRAWAESAMHDGPLCPTSRLSASTHLHVHLQAQ